MAAVSMEVVPGEIKDTTTRVKWRMLAVDEMVVGGDWRCPARGVER